MNSEKTIEELENELMALKETHKSMWNTYGSELCSSDMIRKEEELEEKIQKLKTVKLLILEGLTPDVKEKIDELYEHQKNFVVEDPSRIIDN